MWLLDIGRRDVNKEIVDRLRDRQVDALTVEWWTLLGAKEELMLGKLRRMDCVDDDNVHLRRKSNRGCCRNLVPQDPGGKEGEWTGDRLLEADEEGVEEPVLHMMADHWRESRSRVFFYPLVTS